MKKLAIAALLGMSVSSGANAATVFFDDFESGSLSAFTTSDNVAVADGNVYSICCQTNPSNTNKFAAFDGGPALPASLTKSFNTVLGLLYTVAFDYGAIGGGSDPLTVTAGGQSFDYNPTASNNLTYTSTSFSFLGDGAATTLSFSTPGTFGVDTIIDNVSVSAVPEASTWAMMIFGMGAVGAAMRQRNRKGARVTFA